MVTRTTAEVAFQRMANFRFGWIRIVLQQIGGRHDHAGGAKAALQAVLLAESFLNGVQSAVFGQAFNGGYMGAIGLYCQGGAGLYCLPIYEYGASSTATGIAPDVRASEAECLSKVIHQQLPRLDLAGVLLSVNGY